nr:MAG: hypothetical protein DIU78_08995 [Pseudomonadota bacterium]
MVAGLLRDHLGARAEAQEEATAARRSRATRVAPEERSPEPRERESRPGAEPVAPREPSAARGASGGAPSASRERAVSDASARGSTAREPSTTRDASAPREPSARGPAPAHEAPAAVSDVSARAAKVDHEPAASVPAAGTPDLEPSSAPQSEAETTQVESVELYASVGRRQGARPGDYERLLAEAGIPAEAVAYVRVRHRNAFVGVAPDVVERALQALDGKVVAGARVKAEPSRGRAKAPVESEDGEPASDAQ